MALGTQGGFGIGSARLTKPRDLRLAEVIVGAIVLACAVTLPYWITQLFYPGDFPLGTGVLVIPIVVTLTFALVLKISERDAFLRRILAGGLLVKLAGSAASLYMVITFYRGGDATGYFYTGELILRTIRETGSLPAGPLLSTQFVDTVAAAMLLFVGSSFAALNICFTLLSYWGQYLYLRAFNSGFPEGNKRLAAVLLMFLPSIVYWTAPMGKDSLIMFSMALAVYGYVRVQRRVDTAGWLVFAMGILITALIRPHIAALLGISCSAAYLFGRQRRGMFGIATKAVAAPLLLLGSLYLVSQASSFVQASDFDTAVSKVETIQKGLHVGKGSSFGGPLASRLALMPFLPFRPFPWEVRSLQMAIASLEGTVLLALFWMRRRKMLAALRRWRENPAILMAALYCLQFLIIFSAASGNFGTLSRQRVMMLPLAILLCCSFEPGAAAVPAPAYAEADAARAPDRGRS